MSLVAIKYFDFL